jgi:hypothetical protein
MVGPADRDLMAIRARIEHLADPEKFRYYEPEDADQLRAAVADITTRGRR